MNKKFKEEQEARLQEIASASLSFNGDVRKSCDKWGGEGKEKPLSDFGYYCEGLFDGMHLPAGENEYITNVKLQSAGNNIIRLSLVLHDNSVEEFLLPEFTKLGILKCGGSQLNKNNYIKLRLIKYGRSKSFTFRKSQHGFYQLYRNKFLEIYSEINMARVWKILRSNTPELIFELIFNPQNMNGFVLTDPYLAVSFYSAKRMNSNDYLFGEYDGKGGLLYDTKSYEAAAHYFNEKKRNPAVVRRCDNTVKIATKGKYKTLQALHEFYNKLQG